MHTLQKITKLSWVFVLASMFFYSCNTKNPDEPEEALLVLKFSNMNLIFEKNGNIEIDAILNNILVTPSAKAETKEGKFTLKKLTNINPQDIIALSGVGTPSFAIVMKKQGDFTADLHLLDGNKKEKILKNCVFSLFYKQPVFKESEAEKQQRLNLKKRFDDLMRDYYSGQITAANFNDWAYQIKPYFRKSNPSTTEARPPKMSENFKNYALSWWNFYKEMAQTNICEIGTQDQEIASYAAYGLSVNEQITHRMPNPKGISPNIYDKAKTGALRSNLFGGRGNWSYHRTVQFNFTEGKIPDEGPLNHIPSLSQMGHRWNGLYRNNASVGFGYARMTNYMVTTFRVVGTNKSKNPAVGYAAFPHGYYPVQAEMAKRQNGYTQETLFERDAKKGFKADNFTGEAKYCIWTLQEPRGLTFDAKKDFKITIRDTNEKGKILDQMTTKWNQTFQDKPNGAFFRVGPNVYIQNPTFTIKPKNGLISGAIKEVLGTKKKKAFHLTFEGGLTKKDGKPLTYRIIYYDIEHP